MILGFEWAANLLAFAAIISAVGGVLATWLAHKKSIAEAKDEEQEKCLERLKAARAEGEEAMAELHELRMKEARGQ
jgi:Na+/glutamate symporter